MISVYEVVYEVHFEFEADSGQDAYGYGEELMRDLVEQGGAELMSLVHLYDEDEDGEKHMKGRKVDHGILPNKADMFGGSE